jgi:hypothetical protein
MGWWIAAGALLLALVVIGVLLVWGAHEAAKEEARGEMQRWDHTGGRPPHEDDLLYLAGIARGLRGTTTPRSAEDSQEIGRLMLRLLGHIAELERRPR